MFILSRPHHMINFVFSLILFTVVTSTVPAHSGVFPSPGPEPEQLNTGDVTGRFITKNGESLAGGQVMFYRATDEAPPDMKRYARIPNHIVDIDPGNVFVAILPVGKYYFGALKRNSGKHLGRPGKGDYYFRYRKENSYELKEFTLQEGEHIDFGTLEAQIWQDKVRDSGKKTTIAGTISDMEGKPVANGIVFAFATPRMLGSRPEFISEKSGSDGKYLLQVAGDRTYYLMARNILGGGQVAEGDIIGIHGDQEPAGIPVKTGQTVEDIDIIVATMGHRGPDIKQGEQKEIDLGNIGSKKPSMLPPNDLKPYDKQRKKPSKN